jgi:hypothetical protein
MVMGGVMVYGVLLGQILLRGLQFSLIVIIARVLQIHLSFGSDTLGQFGAAGQKGDSYVNNKHVFVATCRKKEMLVKSWLEGRSVCK